MKSILIFCSGFAFALFIFLAIAVFSFLRHFENYGFMLAPEVYTDKEVREHFCYNHCLGSIELPPTAKELLYIQGGGKDPIYYMAFSASKDDCDIFARKYGLTEKAFSQSLAKNSDFPSALHSLRWEDFTPRLHGKHDEKWPRDYWKINKVKEGFYLDDKSFFMLYDTENSKIYIITYPS